MFLGLYWRASLGENQLIDIYATTARFRTMKGVRGVLLGRVLPSPFYIITLLIFIGIIRHSPFT